MIKNKFFIFAKKDRLKTISFNNKFIALAFGLGIFSWQSCKERSVLPSDLVPPVDNIHTFALDATDLDVQLNVGVLDSAVTNRSSNVIVGLGEIENDPFFGNSYNGLYLQFVPPGENFTFNAAWVLDSAIIALPYTGVSYGDTLAAPGNLLHLNILRVTEPMDNEAPYFTFNQFQTDPALVGGGSFNMAALSDTFHTPLDTMSRQLRIPLTTAFAQSIVSADTQFLASDEKFKEFLNGLYIVPDLTKSQNRVSFFQLVGNTLLASARMDFYLHNADGGQTVTSFPFTLKRCAFVNHIERNHQNTPSAAFETLGEGRDSVLLEGYPGFYTHVVLKNLSQIPQCVVNKAQLSVTVLPVGDQAVYRSPLRLIVERVESDGTVRPILDVLGAEGDELDDAGLDFMDGNPKEIDINGVTYLRYDLNFPRELQAALAAGDTEITLRVSASTKYKGAFRLLGGGLHNSEQQKFKVNVIYTKSN